MLIQYTVYLIVMISSSLRGMASQTERYKYNIVDISDCVIILSLFLCILTEDVWMLYRLFL
jgi:hypothetical protein